MLKRVNVFKTCTRPAAGSISSSAGGGIATADPRVWIMASLCLCQAVLLHGIGFRLPTPVPAMIALVTGVGAGYAVSVIMGSCPASS
ncbi:MAG: hypothetical protein ACRYHA_14585 [Janthinobacterium lividum]